MSTRLFSPLELNHLRKHGFSDDNLSSYGEKPVEYITGHADFYHSDFLVNESTLIPRLESEKIIDLALNFLSEKNISHPAIADIGTGSGCLAISVAKSLSQKNIPYTIFLSDFSPDALAMAEKNATRLLPSTVNLFFELSDLFNSYPAIKFDLIIANLPYIPSSNISTLSSSVLNFEPHSALDGGPGGTVFINRLLQQLPRFLSPDGLAILEIDDSQALSDFSFPPTLIAKLETDYLGVPRFLILHQKD